MFATKQSILEELTTLLREISEFIDDSDNSHSMSGHNTNFRAIENSKSVNQQLDHYLSRLSEVIRYLQFTIDDLSRIASSSVVDDISAFKVPSTDSSFSVHPDQNEIYSFLRRNTGILESNCRDYAEALWRNQIHSITTLRSRIEIQPNLLSELCGITIEIDGIDIMHALQSFSTSDTSASIVSTRDGIDEKVSSSMSSSGVELSMAEPGSPIFSIQAEIEKVMKLIEEKGRDDEYLFLLVRQFSLPGRVYLDGAITIIQGKTPQLINDELLLSVCMLYFHIGTTDCYSNALLSLNRIERPAAFGEDFDYWRTVCTSNKETRITSELRQKIDNIQDSHLKSLHFVNLWWIEQNTPGSSLATQIPLLEEAMRINPRNLRSYMILIEQYSYDAAISLYRRLISLMDANSILRVYVSEMLTRHLLKPELEVAKLKNDETRIAAARNMIRVLGFDEDEDALKFAAGPSITTTRGIDQGRNAWYYVFVDPRMKQEFIHDLGHEIIHLNDDGIILESGNGSDPPAGVTEEIKRQYIDSGPEVHTKRLKFLIQQQFE